MLEVYQRMMREVMRMASFFADILRGFGLMGPCFEEKAFKFELQWKMGLFFI